MSHVNGSKVLIELQQLATQTAVAPLTSSQVLMQASICMVVANIPLLPVIKTYLRFSAISVERDELAYNSRRLRRDAQALCLALSC